MDIFDKILNNKQRGKIASLVDLNNEFSFYSNPLDINTSNNYYNTFFRRLKSLYKDSVVAKRFVDVYMGKKVPSAALVTEILQKLSVVWNGQDQSLSVVLKNESLNGEAENFVKPYIEEIQSKWVHECKESLVSFLVVLIENGLPKLEFIEPYQVVYYSKHDNGILDEIVYKTSDVNVYAYINNEYYALLDVKNSIIYNEVLHNVGFTPGCIFEPTKYIFEYLLQDFFKYTRSVVELEKKEIFDLNVDKILPSTSCGYDENQIDSNGYTKKCIGGRLYYWNGSEAMQPYTIDSEHVYCPVCGEKTHVGAGAVHVYNIEAFSKENSNLSPSDLVNYVSPDIKTTENAQKRTIEIRRDIISRATGVVKSVSKQQRNEIDIMSDFEDATNVIIQFGKVFSVPVNTIVRILVNMKYKPDNVLSTSFFFGTKFFLINRVDLLDEKEKATNGIERLDAIKKLIAYDFQHDKEKYEFTLKKLDLYPYANLTDLQFFEMVKLNLIAPIDIELRSNFDYYIKEFQRETSNNPQLFDFELINNKIRTYAQKTIENNGIEQRQADITGANEGAN